MGEIRTRGLVNFAAAADQSEKEGYCVTLGANGVAVATSATANVAGVIVDGSEDNSDVALFGPYDGTCHFKAGGAITKGSRLMLKADGTVGCAATGLCVGLALESAVADELFEGAPRTPVTIV